LECLALCLPARLCLYTSVFIRLNSVRQRERNSLKANKVTSSATAPAASVDGRLPTECVSSDETTRVVLCISIYHVATASDTKTSHKTAQYSCTFDCQHGGPVPRVRRDHWSLPGWQASSAIM